RPLPALHSFPTRRSSDLTALSSSNPPARPCSASSALTIPTSELRRPSRPSAESPPSSVAASVEIPFDESIEISPNDVIEFKDPRSEEHTSELQSRENLVC